jgi:hypothetical protein
MSKTHGQRLTYRATFQQSMSSNPQLSQLSVQNRFHETESLQNYV